MLCKFPPCTTRFSDHVNAVRDEIICCLNMFKVGGRGSGRMGILKIAEFQVLNSLMPEIRL